MLESNVCSFLNSFSTSKCFNLFDVTFLFKFFNFSSKFVFFTKPAISLLLADFAWANLAKLLQHFLVFQTETQNRNLRDCLMKKLCLLIQQGKV